MNNEVKSRSVLFGLGVTETAEDCSNLISHCHNAYKLKLPNDIFLLVMKESIVLYCLLDMMFIAIFADSINSTLTRRERLYRLYLFLLVHLRRQCSDSHVQHVNRPHRRRILIGSGAILWISGSQHLCSMVQSDLYA